MQLTGIHHLTAVTADARANHAFYTRTLGMRLVKKTVNQDDVSAYHLFYADGRATPGTDLTFFDWPSPRERRGMRSIVRTGLRVAGADSLRYWGQRFQELGVVHGEALDRDGRPTLHFEDGEGQRFALVADDGRIAPNPWDSSPVPAEHQIRGLGPITISVPDLKPTEAVLTRVMGMRHPGICRDRQRRQRRRALTVHVFEMGQGGPAAELHVAVGLEAHGPARRGRRAPRGVPRADVRGVRCVGRPPAASCALRRAGRSTASTSAASTSARPAASCSNCDRRPRLRRRRADGNARPEPRAAAVPRAPAQADRGGAEADLSRDVEGRTSHDRCADASDASAKREARAVHLVEYEKQDRDVTRACLAAGLARRVPGR